jgi:rSAM/selenodomain-associated transferase 2
MKISFIIPVLNEASLIDSQLARLQDLRTQGHEIIVVDGGSGDGGLEIVALQADVALLSAVGRAFQMNKGALKATGEVLLFLHLDTILPDDIVMLVESVTAGEPLCWGWFDVRFSNPAFIFRVVAIAMNNRAALTKVCTGDQALFVSRELFDKVGGFTEIPLMEDVAISKKLRAVARPKRIRCSVETSSRRWEEKGVLRTILLMWKLRLLYFLGRSPNSLAEQYYPKIGD